jgi:hypothetical protein
MAKRALDRRPAWIAIGAIGHTTMLLVIVGAWVTVGEVVLKTYPIGPGFSFALAADGLSLPVRVLILRLRGDILPLALPPMLLALASRQPGDEGRRPAADNAPAAAGPGNGHLTGPRAGLARDRGQGV